MKNKKTKHVYPRIKQIGLKIYEEPVQHVKFVDLAAVLTLLKIKEKFDEYFGQGQTCYICGPYPWDVEAVLERIFSGKLTGSQKYWD